MSRNLGVIAPIPKDSWNSAMTYKALSIVTYNGSLYMAKIDVPAGVLPTVSGYWMLLISQANAENVVKYTAQSATSSEKAQARANIEAARINSYITSASGELTQTAEINEISAMWFIYGVGGGTIQFIRKTTSSSAEQVVKTYTFADAIMLFVGQRGMEFLVFNAQNNNFEALTSLMQYTDVERKITLTCPYGQIIKIQ